MSFVLQPFNYFDSDPSQHVDDALNVLAARDTGTLVYHRQGDLDNHGDVIARDLDCVPVLVRKSAAVAAAAADGITDVMMLTMQFVVYALRHR